MKRTRIKVCGVRDPEVATAAARAGADAVGLVFCPASPRCVTIDQARRVVAALPAFVEPVGLFVDESTQRVHEVADAVGLRTVQLHGRETPAYVSSLMPLRVIKAMGFDPDTAADVLSVWGPVREYLAGWLWDAPVDVAEASEGGTVTGGRGVRLDWDALANLQRSGGTQELAPVILAGGLNPDNVGRAIDVVVPYAVDVSSGVESSRGVKDPRLIRAFCDVVHRANAGSTDS